MATTMKGSSVGKEKKGASPSSSLIKKSSKPSTSTPCSSTSLPTEEKMSSSTDGKPVPNYLRPTMSSNRDFSRLPKKPTTDPTAQKPATLNRRRSFDRPPPASQVQKAMSNAPGTSEIKPLRSSSFSHKSGTSSASSVRPASDKTYARTTSTLKEGKTDSSFSKSRSIKKSTLSATITPTTKKDAKRPTSSSSTKKPPKSMTSESSIDHDNMAIDHLIIEDDLVGIENEVQSLPEISEMPDSNQELGDPTITVTDLEVKEVENVAENLAIPYERKTVEHNLEEKNENHIFETHENHSAETQPEPENVEDLGNDQNVTVEEHNVTIDSDEEDTETQHAEKKETEFAEEAADAGKQETEFAEENKEEEAEAGKQETELAEEKKEEAGDEGKKETEFAEEKKEESVALEKKEDLSEVKDEKVSVSSPANAKVQTSSLGKKDKQDYNNIIEETSSKLMGGRKNKVLALAGAFETVISLQDTNKN